VGPLYEEVLRHYGEDRASLVFKHFPLGFHKQAQLAAEASMAAHAQDKFWEYADLMFANQQKLERTSLEDYARQIGLNMEKFTAALDNKTYEERVKEDMGLCQKAGVQGTPTIFINGRKYEGPREGPKIIELIDKELLKKK
jgi:protein-disulfide isomerase